MTALPMRAARSVLLIGVAGLLFASHAPLSAADFNVTAESFESNYTINGAPDSPALTLVRGRTYTFAVNACPCHPFEIVGAPPGSLTNNNTADQTITFVVPNTATNYTYRCSIHSFGGGIQTVPDTPPLTPIQTWRQLHFGTTDNSGDAADLFDFDKDGLVNLLEFAFGLDPKDGASVQLPAGQFDGTDFVITFAQPADVGGVTYQAEWSSTLQPAGWTNIPDTGTASQHTFKAPAQGNAKVFVRLKVTGT